MVSREVKARESPSNHEKSRAHTENGFEKYYLTFDTILPTPNPISVHGPSAVQPEAPNIKILENPQTWHWLHKAVAVGTSSFGCLLVAYTSAAYAFAVPGIANEFGISRTVANIGITSFNLGFAFTPMLCAPLSESVGRYPVFLISGFLFVISQLCCGVTTTYAGLVISRFLAGCGGSTFSTIIGGVISDIYLAADRNTPMAVFSSTTLIGVGTGLSISGSIVQGLNWRWVFYVQTILSAVAVLLVSVFLKETRGSVVLRRRAQALNKWYDELEDRGFLGVATPRTDVSSTSTRTSLDGNFGDTSVEYKSIRWTVEADEKRPDMLNLIGISVVRPFKMLFTEPVVFFFSMWAMFTWSVLYITFESVPLMFTISHGFNDRQNGLVFLSMAIATLLVLPACIAQDIYQRRRGNKDASPESRLVFVCFLSSCMPIGLFWIGWTQYSSTPWIVPVMGLGCLSIGLFTIYLAVFNYFADVYGLYASSAMAAQSFCRNFTSSVFPFFSNTMFIQLGFGPAASLLGGIGVILMIAPILLMLNGPKIRARSKFVS